MEERYSRGLGQAEGLIVSVDRTIYTYTRIEIKLSRVDHVVVDVTQ